MADHNYFTELERRLSRLEASPKDVWDKLSIVGALLVPASIALVGYFYTQASSDAKIRSEERIAEQRIELEQARSDARIRSEELIAKQRHEIALATAGTERLSLVAELFDALLDTDPRKQKLATNLVLVVLPELGPDLLRALSAQGSESGARAAAATVLNDRRTTLIADLFSQDAATRGNAYTGLINGWGSDSTVIPLLLEHARSNLDNADGVYNTLVFFSHMRKSALRPFVEALREFAEEARQNGERTSRRSDILLERLPDSG